MRSCSGELPVARPGGDTPYGCARGAPLRQHYYRIWRQDPQRTLHQSPPIPSFGPSTCIFRHKSCAERDSPHILARSGADRALVEIVHKGAARINRTLALRPVWRYSCSRLASAGLPAPLRQGRSQGLPPRCTGAVATAEPAPRTPRCAWEIRIAVPSNLPTGWASRSPRPTRRAASVPITRRSSLPPSARDSHDRAGSRPWRTRQA